MTINMYEYDNLRNEFWSLNGRKKNNNPYDKDRLAIVENLLNEMEKSLLEDYRESSKSSRNYWQDRINRVGRIQEWDHCP